MADGTPRAPVAFQAAAADRLYIIDARNRVERRVLLDWVHATAGDLGGEQAPQWVSLSIAEGEHAPHIDKPEARLHEPGGPQVVPTGTESAQGGAEGGRMVWT